MRKYCEGGRIQVMREKRKEMKEEERERERDRKGCVGVIKEYKRMVGRNESRTGGAGRNRGREGGKNRKRVNNEERKG